MNASLGVPAAKVKRIVRHSPRSRPPCGGPRRGRE